MRSGPSATVAPPVGTRLADRVGLRRAHPHSMVVFIAWPFFKAVYTSMTVDTLAERRKIRLVGQLPAPLQRSLLSPGSASDGGLYRWLHQFQAGLWHDCGPLAPSTNDAGATCSPGWSCCPGSSLLWSRPWRGAPSMIPSSAGSTPFCWAWVSSRSPYPGWPIPKLAMAAVISVNVWAGIPFFTVNILAGLSSIDKELYEAAEIDGANAWNRFVHVTLPGLRYVLAVATLLSTVWTFNNFETIFLLTGWWPWQRDQGLLHHGLREGHPLPAVWPRDGCRLQPAAHPGLLHPAALPLHAAGRGTGWTSAAPGRMWSSTASAAGSCDRQRWWPCPWGWSSGCEPHLAPEGRASQRRNRWWATACCGGWPDGHLLTFILFPFYWIIITAFKGNLQIGQREDIFWPNPGPLSSSIASSMKNPSWSGSRIRHRRGNHHGAGCGHCLPQRLRPGPAALPRRPDHDHGAPHHLPAARRPDVHPPLRHPGRPGRDQHPVGPDPHLSHRHGSLLPPGCSWATTGPSRKSWNMPPWWTVPTGSRPSCG
ncbi:MAG: hypothetical protein KatS3mg050_1051 [Litorilinea sp.]|nr:MAG: hypothetical protein KatS3mg050_1051 [Litorilinea sp.]